MDYASGALFRSANPSAIHELGVKEKNKLENARKKIAKILSAHHDEIIFTSGATESINLAIKGVFEMKSAKGKHIIASGLEHHSVLESLHQLDQYGFQVSLIAPKSDGVIAAERHAAVLGS